MPLLDPLGICPTFRVMACALPVLWHAQARKTASFRRVTSHLVDISEQVW
jgi:hypothetical protein